jgi:hypothetical protein
VTTAQIKMAESYAHKLEKATFGIEAGFCSIFLNNFEIKGVIVSYLFTTSET